MSELLCLAVAILGFAGVVVTVCVIDLFVSTPPPSAMQSAHLRNMKTCPECLAAGKKSRGESKRAERRTCEVCGEPYMALRRSQRRCPRCIEELRGCTVEYHKRWRERHGIV